ncbi:MAG: hypothetical protein H6765_06045 [Candidatus Peribacteria bacterium]|nr:MAG: hypothetical protein H6765_06045 [Candidatus Peribacteria bacterium]
MRLLSEQNRELPGITTRTTDNPDGSQTVVSVCAPLRPENISLDYFVFPKTVSNPTQQRVLCVSGVYYTITGTDDAPTLVDNGAYADIRAWLASLPAKERAIRLQQYTHEMLQQYLSFSARFGTQLYFSYAGAYFSAEQEGGELVVYQELNPTPLMEQYSRQMPVVGPGATQPYVTDRTHVA